MNLFIEPMLQPDNVFTFLFFFSSGERRSPVFAFLLFFSEERRKRPDDRRNCVSRLLPAGGEVHRDHHHSQ